MFRNSLRLLGIVALAAAIGLPVSASAQGNSGGGNSGGGPDWGAFQGLGPDGTAVVGNDKSVVAVSPGDYPSDDAGNSTFPTWESVFPDGVPEPTDLTGIGGNETEVHPILVVDTDFEMKGTSLFVGVIVIRNCGSIRMAGNPNVYGAIIIDATRPTADGTDREECPQPYDPFAGAGTPAVRFVGGPGGGGSGVGTDQRGLTIWNERFQ